MLFKIVKCNMPVQAGDILLPADPRTRHDLMIIVSSSNIFRHILLSINIRFLSEQYLSELSSWSLRQRGYHHRIPDAAPLRALSTPPIVVIRESGLTIIILELELEFGRSYFMKFEKSRFKWGNGAGEYEDWQTALTSCGTASPNITPNNCREGKGIGLDTCYSANYMSQTRDQQRFTISEVAADWHEPMVPQRIMWPSIARANGQLDPRCSQQTHHHPNQLQ